MIRYIFDDTDGLNKAPASVEFAKQLLLKHFKLSNIIGMLDLLYAKFEKAHVASFAGVLASGKNLKSLCNITTCTTCFLDVDYYSVYQ